MLVATYGGPVGRKPSVARAARARRGGARTRSATSPCELRFGAWEKDSRGGRPPLGQGVGAVGAAARTRRPADRTTDNSFLKVLVDQGVPGLALFAVGMVGGVALLARRLRRAEPGALRPGGSRRWRGSWRSWASPWRASPWSSQARSWRGPCSGWPRHARSADRGRRERPYERSAEASSGQKPGELAGRLRRRAVALGRSARERARGESAPQARPLDSRRGAARRGPLAFNLAREPGFQAAVELFPREVKPYPAIDDPRYY